MNIQTEKLHLIEWLAKTTKPSVMRQADRGEVVPHKQVMAKYKKWLIK